MLAGEVARQELLLSESPFRSVRRAFQFNRKSVNLAASEVNVNDQLKSQSSLPHRCETLHE